ncbi:MAG TPA: GNAT family N-acetyltransferase [Pyrinomonadaceae bacterium]|nr:GNAT family N-acetyltransferase [Pyrinomonadaceae bacterium]
MSRTLDSVLTQTARARRAHAAPDGRPSSPQLLVRGQEKEALEFLAAHPVQNVIMMSFIRDNGFESSLNRGDFYACRDKRGELTGVALIGHHVLFAAERAENIGAFARQARERRDAHVIVGEREAVGEFWSVYARADESPLLVNKELLLELKWPIEVREFVPGLRPATFADIKLVAEVHAQMAFAESRKNPLEVDREGFLARIARRVEQGRLWVWVEDGRLIFKTDISSHTPEVIYLEGVYVHPDERGNGYGLRCLSQLSRELLSRAKSVCLLVNEQNEQAQTFYRRAGYKLHSNYDTIYLPPRT